MPKENKSKPTSAEDEEFQVVDNRTHLTANIEKRSISSVIMNAPGRLASQALAIYVLLCATIGKPVKAKTIIKTLHVSNKTYWNIIKFLDAAGYIERKPVYDSAGGKLANAYAINDCPADINKPEPTRARAHTRDGVGEHRGMVSENTGGDGVGEHHPARAFDLDSIDHHDSESKIITESTLLDSSKEQDSVKVIESSVLKDSTSTSPAQPAADFKITISPNGQLSMFGEQPPPVEAKPKASEKYDAEAKPKRTRKAKPETPPLKQPPAEIKNALALLLYGHSDLKLDRAWAAIVKIWNELQFPTLMEIGNAITNWHQDWRYLKSNKKQLPTYGQILEDWEKLRLDPNLPTEPERETPIPTEADMMKF